MKESASRGGLFITLEGPDGAGKSTQAVRLAEALRAQGHSVVLLREPGGTTVGEAIRSLLLANAPVAHNPTADAILFNAARAQLVPEVIRPSLARGDVVVCDRFADSTLAYQGYGSGLDLDWLDRLNRWATGNLVPDLTLLLDLTVEEGLRRRATGPSGEQTRFERDGEYDRGFHERVRDGYRALAASEPERWRTVDASRPPAAVASAILDHVARLLPVEPIRSTVRMT
jgi:dTMP kinase